jgi:prohibitin 1
MRLVIAILLALVAVVLWRAGAGATRPRLPAIALGALAILLALSSALVIIPAGHVGVVDLFGQVSPVTLKSGIRLVNPLARVTRMSVQTQERKETMDVPSKEGLTVQIEVSALYHLDPDRAAEIYRTVGANYLEVLLVPQFRSVSRGVTAGYDARSLYTSQREQLAELVADVLRQRVGSRGIVIESTPLRRLELPKGLAASIEQKLQSEQESQRMEFVIQRERQEADRKRIEAQGIADFQRIVSDGISEPLLRWKGIEATNKLAESTNAKVVVIGGGKDGLPLILGGDK